MAGVEEPLVIDFTMLVAPMIWVMLWRAFGMWYAARNKQKVWYVLSLIDPIAVVPIVYLFLFSKTPLLNEMESWGKKTSRKKKSRRKKKKR